MQEIGFKTATAIAAAVAYLALSGCADSNVLQTSTGAATMSIEVVGAGAATQYDEATLLGISQIMLRPVDPAADQALGPDDIGVLVGATDVLDLVGGSSVSVPAIVLSPGVYRVTRIRLIPDGNIVRLADYDPPPPPRDDNCDGFPDTPDTRRCLDRVLYPYRPCTNPNQEDPPPPLDPPTDPVLPTPGNVGGQPRIDLEYQVLYGDPDTAPRISIQDQADTPVVLLVDGQGLIADFEASFDCQETSICQGGGGIPPPCNAEFFEEEGTSAAGVHFDGFIPLFQDKFQF